MSKLATALQIELLQVKILNRYYSIQKQLITAYGDDSNFKYQIFRRTSINPDSSPFQHNKAN